MEAMLVRKHEWESTTKKTSNRCVVKRNNKSTSLHSCKIKITHRSWDRVCVVLKGTEVIFYKDQKSYRSAPSATFKGEPPVEILGATAGIASDYTKKKNVFRLK